MALVLPMAAVQQHFCTMGMVFVQGNDDCKSDVPTGCCSDDEAPSEMPNCMTSAKFLPDGDVTESTELPIMESDGVFVPAYVAHEISQRSYENVFPVRDRAPPDFRLIYKMQHKLLI